MKILITGKSGQLGSQLEKSLASCGEIIALDRMSLNLESERAIRSTIKNIAPDLIFNTAAFTAVDAAEHERTVAWNVNAMAPGIIGQAAADIGASVVHFSTDYVFDGSLKRPYKETDPTGPLNFYGESKLAGEKTLSSSGAHFIIFRISWIYAETGRNFLGTIMRLAGEREHLEVVADQIGAPTPAHCVADAMAKFVKQAGKFSPTSLGCHLPVVHLSCQGQASWYDFACAIIDRIRASGNHPILKTISAISTDAYPTPTSRPKNSRLDSTLCHDTFEIALPEWKSALDAVMMKLHGTA